MNNYHIGKIIGRGAFGHVYLAKNKSNNQAVAIKKISTDCLSSNEKQDTTNEVNILLKLQNHNIIQFYGSFIENGDIYIIMEYAEKGSLSDYLKKRKETNSPLHFLEVEKIFFQIALGLHQIHKQKIIHRDIKSSNILLTKTMKVKISDFGLSKILSSKHAASSVLGTPSFYSPELCEGKPYDAKTDIWALGCVLYEMITFRKPFESSNLSSMIMNIMTCNYERLSRLHPDKRLVEIMIEPNVAKRANIEDILTHPILLKAGLIVRSEFGWFKEEQEN